MDKNGSIAPTKRLLYSLIILFVGLLAILVIGELMMRSRGKLDLKALTSRTFTHNPMREWAFINPYAAYSPRPGQDTNFGKSVNNFGFISTPAIKTVPKPAGRIRIAFLGGSSTAGTGTLLKDEDTWPYQTWLALQKALPQADIEMINAAANGYTSFESYGRLWSQVRFFAPDIVLVYHGWNEMYYFDDTDPNKILTRTWKPDRDWGFPPIEIPRRLAPIWLDRFFQWSELYSAIRIAGASGSKEAPAGELGGEKKSDSQLADSFDPAGVDIFRQNLLLMKTACEVIGAEFYVVKQATLITEDLPPAMRDERCFTWYHTFNYQAHLQAFSAINQMISTSFPPNRVIDATVMSGNPDLLFDHVHLTPEGSRNLAKIVLEALVVHSDKLAP